MAQTVVGRWGKSLAVRVPGEIADVAGLDDGQQVDVVATNDAIIIRKIAPNLTADKMFSGRSPDEWRRLYADAYDWGPDLGRERIGE